MRRTMAPAPRLTRAQRTANRYDAYKPPILTNRAPSCLIAPMKRRLELSSTPDLHVMNLSALALLHLLHRCPVGTLATHLREPAGFPFPTILPFAPDPRHRPVIVVSGLAEHTRNLQVDPRAGFLVADSAGGDVLAAERATLIGRFSTFEASPALVRRYLRYHPEADRYLALGDFSFRVMEIERIRYIAGFGAMGWKSGAELYSYDQLPEEDEVALIEYFERHARRAAHLQLIGIDRYGVDVNDRGVRRRLTFDGPKATVSELERSIDDCIKSHTD
jgi:heme iron utilization protein